LDDLIELEPGSPQHGHRVLEIVTHQEKLLPERRLAWVNGNFRRWQLEDQPPMAGVNVRIAQNVAKERSVGLRVRAVDDDMRSRNSHSANVAYRGRLVIAFAITAGGDGWCSD
jgi:hypothetical protein